MMMNELSAVTAFLRCRTPDAWLQAATQQLEVLLVDHANCEKKAAATAMNLMYRYIDKPLLLEKMSQLAREELLHFEQVVKILQQRGIAYVHMSPSRYASALREHIRTYEPGRLTDTLIIGAFVEARSCERFAALVPLLDAPLQKFYASLLKAEARHFEDYLHLAQSAAGSDITARVNFFAELEAELIVSPDDLFRFHSGVPCSGEGSSAPAA